MIQKYYILSPVQKVDLYVTTLLFILLFVLLRPVLLGLPIYGRDVMNMSILFFVWLGLTVTARNALSIASKQMSDHGL